MTNLKVGVVGLRQGNNHVRIFQRYIDETEVVAACDINEEAARTVADAENIDRVYVDFADLLQDKDVDVVVIATPGYLHGQQTLAALEAGKHVLVEVPMVENKLEECLDIVKAVERTGLKLQMGNQMRWHDVDRKIKSLVTDGSLGQIAYAEAEYLHNLMYLFVGEDGRTWRDGFGTTTQETLTSGGGIHAIDSMRWFLGEEFVEVVGYGNRINTPYRSVNDFEVALFKTGSGAIAKAGCSKALVRPGCFHYRSVYGTRGSVETSRVDEEGLYGYFVEHDTFLHYGEAVGLCTGHSPFSMEPVQVESEPIADEIARETGHAGYSYLQDQDFVDAIIEDRLPTINVYEAARSCAAALSALRSINEGGRPVRIPQFYNRLEPETLPNL